jgi:hypothetical protein
VSNLEKIISYWKREGIIIMIIGLILTIILIPLVMIFDVWEGRIFIATFIAPAFFLLGLIMFVVGKYGDMKLKRLKRTGKVYTPTKTTLVPKVLPTSQFSVRNSQYFYIECMICNEKGKEIKLKSRDLIVCIGLTAVPTSPNMGYDAIVHVHPRRPWIYAVEVFLC